MNYAAIATQEPKLNAILAAVPGAIIAGGYLRDLLLDKPTRDIDIFMERMPSLYEINALNALLGCTLFERVIDIDENYTPEGGRTSDIRVVYQTDDERVNVIVVDNVQTHILEFPDNISKVFYGPDGLGAHAEFTHGHEQMVIRYRVSAAAARLVKLQAKFPDYGLEYTT